MPEATFRHKVGEIMTPSDDGGRDLGWTGRTLEPFGRLVRPLLAEAFSTSELKFTDDDIDWVPDPWPPGTIVSAPCSLIIRTFGYEERVLTITVERALKLKSDIIDIAEKAEFVRHENDRKFFRIPRDKPLLWVQYTFIDPQKRVLGIHV